VTVKIIARVMLSLGFLAASVGYSSWIAQQTILDPSATHAAARALLATPTVKSMLAKEIRKGLGPALGNEANTPQLTTALDAAVADPKFAAAYEDAIVSIQKAVFSDGNSRVTLDSAAVTKAISEAVASVDPKAAARMKKVRAVNVPVGSSSLPHVSDARARVAFVERIALSIALLLIGGALLLAHDRKMFRRAGVRLALLALGPVFAFVALPRLLVSAGTGPLAVAGAMLGIRNPRGHKTGMVDDPDVCLDHLSLASMLVRRLDEAGLR